MIQKINIFIFLLYFIQVNFLAGQQWHKVFCDIEPLTPMEVLESYDKGYLIASTLSPSGYLYTGIVYKTDINGNLLWQKNIGDGSYISNLWSFDNTSDSGLILFGNTRLVSSSNDPYIIKLNTCGEKEWCCVYDIDNDGCSGHQIKYFNNGYLGLIAFLGPGQQNTRISLVRFDIQGNILWEHLYAQEDTDIVSEEAYDLQILGDSCFLITGDCYYPDTINPSTWVYQRSFIIKTDTSGNELWELAWGVPQGIISDAWQSTSDVNGTIYSAGRQARQVPPYGDSPILLTTSASGLSISLFNLKDSTYHGVSTTIDWFADSTLAIAGTYGKEWFVFDTMSHFVYKVNRSGLVEDSLVLFEKNAGGIFDAVHTFDDKLVLLAIVDECIDLFKVNSNLEWDSIYTAPYQYDYLCPHAIASDTIMLDCDTIVHVLEHPKPEERGMLFIYPNPAGEKITIRLPQSVASEKKTAHFNVTRYDYVYQEGSVIELLDLWGKKWQETKLTKGQKEIVMDVTSLPPGMYLVRLVVKGSTYATGKVMVVR